MSLFDHSAEDYDSWCSTPIGSYVDFLEKQLMGEVAQPKKGETAIDLGCGTGIYSIWLAEKGLSVTGIDSSAQMIKVAEVKTTKRNLNIHYQKADLHCLPFEDHSFDLAVCNIVLEFVEDPEKVLAEGLRVLKKGGRLVVGMIGKHSEWGKTYQTRGKQNKESVFAHARFFSSNEIKLLSKNQPVVQRYGLYITPTNLQNKKIADQIEDENQALKLEEGAGYIVLKWVKWYRERA